MRWGKWLAGWLTAGSAALAGQLAAAPTQSPYLGSWRIAAAQVAPWAAPDTAASTAESKRLIGRTVVYAPARIAGPAPLACAKPRYRLHEAPLDELFQGGLTAPDKQAAALGFRGRTARTLETGCAGWIDFHYVDARTALFGLNDMIYTLRRQ